MRAPLFLVWLVGVPPLAGCAADFRGLERGTPEGRSVTTVAPEVYVPQLRFNEVMPKNDSTIMEPSLGFPDWIELVNVDDASLPLSRVVIQNEGGDSWQGPDGASLAPGAPLMLWAGGADDTADTLPFALTDGSGTLTLLVDGVVVDDLAVPELPGDVSLARFPDGGAWAATTRPTPGATNGNTPGATTDPSELLFGDLHIQEMYITLDSGAIASLWSDPYTEVLGSFAYEGAFFPRVGVNLKGVYGSLRNLSQKCAFKVDLDAYDDHRLRGLEKLTLNNMVQDPSYTHEYLVYTLFRAMGVPAPRVGYAHVYLNGVYYGLYAHLESPDDTFLARWYTDPGGNLYEGKYGDDFYASYLWSFEHDEGPEDDDRSELAALITALDQAPDDAGIAQVEAMFDLDEFLAEQAVEAIAYHWDGYESANNYRIYLDPLTLRFSMMPWGSDQTFHDAYYQPYDSVARLFGYCMSNAGCAARYAVKLREAADIMESLALEAEMDHLNTWLYADITADPRREYGMETHDQWIEDTRAILRSSPERVRQAAAAHGG